jgi:cystathionine beta-lyase/cystathionine gamma-synthase
LTTDDILFGLGEGEDLPDGVHPVIPPLYQSANFSFRNTAQLREALAAEQAALLYTRGNNPTTSLLRQKIAALEGAEDALVFGSGMGAISAAVLSQVAAGQHVLCAARPYPWTAWLLRDWLPRFGVQTTFVEGGEAADFSAHWRPNTRLVVLESPNSFQFALQDLEGIAKLARERGARSLVDNSYAGPLLQRPLTMGIDLVLHSASKYLNGHGDVIAGAVCGSKALLTPMFRQEWQGLGGILSPFDAWLVLRGLRTLPLRMERIGTTASALVARLAVDNRVEAVHYPFHPSHPQHQLALRQMSGPSGQFSITLATRDTQVVERFCDSLKHFRLAVSWGGFESLVIPALAKPGGEQSDPALLRFCAGLEDPEWLWADLLQALDRAFGVATA